MAIALGLYGLERVPLLAQEDPLSSNEVTRLHRERFEPRVDAALAAASKRYFSWKASIEFDLVDQEMAAEDLAEVLFSEDLRDFRAELKLKVFLEQMIQDLDAFMGKAPDAIRIQMLNQLEGALLKRFAESKETAGFAESRLSRRNQSIWFGGLSVATVHLGILMAYFVWMKVVRNLPTHAGNFKEWLAKNKNRLVLYYELRRAVKKGNRGLAQECRQKLRDLAPEKFKLPPRDRVLKFLGRAGFWLVIDSGIAAGLATGSYFWIYRPLRAWRTQELFLEDQFSEFVIDRKRMRPQTSSDSNQSNPK